jgi:hypothetical protein
VVRGFRIAALAGCVASGCGDNPELRFEIAFAQSELAQRAAVIEARIVEGGCDSEALVYVSTFDPEREGMRPPLLAPGRYAFRVRAQDSECFWYAQGCRAVTLPGGGPAIAVELDAIDVESRDCDAPTCRALACEPAPDAAAPMAGRGGSGGSDAGAMDAAANPPDDDAGEPPRDAGMEPQRPPVQVTIEAESAERLSAPLVRTDNELASGGAYISYPADPEVPLTERQALKRAVAPMDDAADGIALYRFDVPRSGSYRIWGRVIAATLDEDSFWLRVDDRAWVQWNDIAHSDTWLWVDVRPFEQRLERWIVELDAGEHVIRISYRELGARIDQLLLTTDVDFVPGSL